MTTTGDALLQAIVDDPDDDALRLIYADWLDDHGDAERAEFIRVEVALFPRYLDATAEDGPPAWRDPEFARLQARRFELLHRHREAWFGPLAGLVRNYTTVRGFVHYADLDARVLAARADELFAAAPLLRMAYLDKLGKNLPAVARRPELGRLRDLHFLGTTLGDAGVRDLCASPHLGDLKTFTAVESRVGTAGAVALARTTALAGLERLEIEDGPVYDAGAAALLATPLRAGLKHLALENCGLTPRAFRPLTRGEMAMRLETLSLAENHLDALADLAGCAALAGLRRLTLRRNPLGDAVADLAGSPYLRALEGLDLGGVAAGDAAVAALLRSDVAATVRDLSLRENPLGGAAVAALQMSGRLGRLEELNLGRCEVGPAAAEGLAWATWPALRDLALYDNPLGPGGVRALVATGLFAGLEVLGLGGCRLGDAGAEVLAGAAVLRGVRSLALGDNRIGNRGALALARSPHLDRLASLSLWKNPIGPRARKALAERFGDRVGY